MRHETIFYSIVSELFEYSLVVHAAELYANESFSPAVWEYLVVVAVGRVVSRQLALSAYIGFLQLYLPIREISKGLTESLKSVASLRHLTRHGFSADEVEYGLSQIFVCHEGRGGFQRSRWQRYLA